MAKTEGGKGVELSYHLHRLFDSKEADPEQRRMAAASIGSMLQDTLQNFSDALLPKFLQLCDTTPDLGIRADAVKILGYRWCTRAEVQKLMADAFQSDAHEENMLHLWINAVIDRCNDSPEISQDTGIGKMIGDAHVLLSGTVKETAVNYSVLDIMNLLLRWIKASYACELGVETESIATKRESFLVKAANLRLIPDEKAVQYLSALLNAEQKQQWVQGLLGFCQRHQNETFARREIDAAKFLLIYLGQNLESMRLAEPRKIGSVFALIEMLQRPKNNTLRPGEEAALAKHIHEHFRTPAALLEELFQARRYVFLYFDAPAAYCRIAPLLAKLPDVTHLAINIGPQRKDAFRKFLEGGELPEEISLCRDVSADFVREKLQECDALQNLEWGFVGSALTATNPRGELALDQHVRHLAAIQATNPAAKVLVLNFTEISFFPEFARRALTSLSGDRSLSVAEALSNSVGMDQVASVLVRDEDCRFDGDPDAEGGEIGEFCGRHGIINSFGVLPQETPLREKHFDTEYRDLYSQTWDGLLVLLSRDSDPESHVEEDHDPSLQSGRGPRRKVLAN